MDKLEQILSKFENGHEIYKKDPVFNLFINNIITQGISLDEKAMQLFVDLLNISDAQLAETFILFGVNSKEAKEIRLIKQ